MLISFLAGLLLIFSGVAIKYFKWYFLIAGYNTATQKAKEAVDIKGLASFMGNMLFLSGGLLILSSILYRYGYRTLSMVMIFLMLVAIFYMTFKASAFSKAKPQEKKFNKIAIIGALIPGVIIMLLATVPGARVNEAILEENHLRVTGMSGNTFTYDSMEELQLLDNIPNFRKVAGYNFGNINKGTFQVEGLGRGNLYMHSGNGPFLYIKLKGDRGFVIINYKDRDKTLGLYEDLKERIGM